LNNAEEQGGGDISPLPPKVLTLDKAVDDEGSRPFTLSTLKQRASFKLYNIAAGLAGVLWLVLASVIGFHFFQVSQLCAKLAALAPGTTGGEYAEKAIAALDSTAKTLYTFLTPLVAGVTGYFFSEIKASNKTD